MSEDAVLQADSKNSGRAALLLLLLIGVILGLLNRDRFEVDVLTALFEQVGVFAPLVFIAIYALGAVLFLPGWILTVLAGAMFGPWLGTLYSLCGATLGAVLAFLCSRYIAAERVEAAIGEGRLLQLKQGVEAEGWRFVAFTRLVPLFPYNLLNYAFGLTRIGLLNFVWSSAVFMLPGGFAYVYLGYAGSEAISGGEDSLRLVLIALALLASVGYLPRLLKRFSSIAGDEDQ